MVATAGRAGVILLACLCVALTAYARFAPLDQPESVGATPGSVFLDSRGSVLERDGGAGLRIPVTLERVAPRMLQATISAEDRRFQRHFGIDPIAMARAAVSSGEQPSGASTITQQLARRLYLADDPSPLAVRKTHEILIALQLEANRSKAEILQLYVNDVYYGRGAYGVEAAARVYFGVGAANLDLAHASYLAGLPQRPADYDSDLRAAGTRQAYVLGRMVEDGWITRAEADAAAAEPIVVLPAVRSPIAQAFVTLARAELARVRPDLADRDGLIVETTLDAGLTTEVERLARLRLAELAERKATNAAVVAIEPGTGRIRAYVGSATSGDPAHGGAFDMARTLRQPGSALKPFLYASAFERGFTAASPLLDVPTAFTSRGVAPYAPLNFDRTFHGVVPLRIALASSLNVPAVRTIDVLGAEAMVEIARRFGISTLGDADRYGLALSLGAGEVRLLDLTNAYAALGAGGMLVEPFAVERVRDASGRVVYERAPASARRVLSAEHAYLLTDILSDPDARIPGFGGVTPFDVPFPAAVKSGTSTGFRDDWTVGYTPEIAIGVWVGNTDGAPMIDVAGVEGAGPIWRNAMMAATLGRRASFERPAAIVETTVCSPTGLLPGPFCPSPVRELFVAGTEPRSEERYYARDLDGRIVVDPPLEARDWARAAGLALRSDGPPSSTEAIRIVSPTAGSTLFFAPEVVEQRLVLRTAITGGVDRITFEIDGRVVGSTSPAEPWVIWTLEPGAHTVRATALLRDGSTATVTSAFEVKR